MSNEKIYNRRCLIRRSDHRVYCGKCGKMVMQDEYNLKKHAKQCGFKPFDLIKIFRENEDFTYGMREEEKTMNYYVFTPRMVLRPGFQDRYIHGTWTKVYAASFSKTEKKMTEEGLKNFHYWIRQKMDSMNEAPDYEVVRNSFGILEHENLEMFFEIYHGKGYRYRQLMPPEEEYGEEPAWFEGEDYLVRIPELPQDLIWESEELHHCVRTYVDRVIEGRTQICFLRRREAPDIPFVTMEIVDSVLI